MLLPRCWGDYSLERGVSPNGQSRASPWGRYVNARDVAVTPFAAISTAWVKYWKQMFERSLFNSGAVPLPSEAERKGFAVYLVGAAFRQFQKIGE